MKNNKRIVRLAELVGGFPRGAHVTIDEMEKQIAREIRSLREQVSDLGELLDRQKSDFGSKVAVLREILLPRP